MRGRAGGGEVGLAQVVLRCLLPVPLTALVVGYLLWLAPGREFTAPALRGFVGEAGAAGPESATAFVWGYCAGLLRGDAGVSTTFQAPVAGLIGERLGESAVGLARSAALVFPASLGLALLSAWHRRWRGAARLVTGVVYAIPAGLFAVPVLYLGWPAEVAVMLGALPKGYALCDAVLERWGRAPHLHWMRAMGAGRGAVLWHGLVRAGRGELLEIAAVMVPVLLGTLIVVEVLSGRAGLGTLAWRAVQGRDLPLLGATTVLLAGASSGAAALAALGGRR